MKNIHLKTLTIRNFKGIELMTCDFDQVTNFAADNRGGKTTLADAYTWLLFGKNSEDQKGFSIKNTVKTELNRNDHEVEGVFDDGTILKRIYREKWVKKRGEAEAEFSGHTTEYFINDVPVPEKEYAAMVDEMMGGEIGKYISDPLHFLSMDWKDRRAILEKMANVTDENVLDEYATLQNKDQVLIVTNAINSKSLQKSLDESKARKKLLKPELDAIPTRIDEAHRSMPEVRDWNSIESLITIKRSDITRITNNMESIVAAQKSEQDKIAAKQKEKFELESKLRDLSNASQKNFHETRNSLNISLSEIRSSKRLKESEIESKTNEVNRNLAEINRLDAKNNELRKALNKREEDTFKYNDSDCVCPTCERKLDNWEDKVSQLKHNFDKAKKADIDAYNKTGIANKETIEKYRKANEVTAEEIKELWVQVTQLQTLISEKESEIAALKSPAQTEEEIELVKQIAAFVIPELTPPDLTKQKEQIKVLQAEIDEAKAVLATRDQITKTTARIDELKAQEKKLAQEIANLERVEFAIENYENAKMRIIQERVNKMFKYVRFEMFRKQINGGIEQICEATAQGGVPFNDLNFEGKVNAGLDCCNALGAFFNLRLPIWIDNRESVTEIIPVEAQVINLFKDEKYKTLTKI